jgi:hypothetical protein
MESPSPCPQRGGDVTAQDLHPSLAAKHFPESRIQGFIAVFLDGSPADAKGRTVHQRLQGSLRSRKGLLHPMVLGHVVGHDQFLFTAVLFEPESSDLGKQKAAILALVAPDSGVGKAILVLAHSAEKSWGLFGGADVQLLEVIS